MPGTLEVGTLEPPTISAELEVFTWIVTAPPSEMPDISDGSTSAT